MRPGPRRSIRRSGFFRLTLLLAVAAVLPAPAATQTVAEAVEMDVVRRIRAEGLERSRLPDLARHLTEVIGPRLTGSPQMDAANEWVADTFRDWGLVGVSVEPWGEFGRGWERVDFGGHVLSPYRQPLRGQPSAWTGSTDGAVRGPAVIVRAEDVGGLEAYRGRLANAFVLVDEPQEVEPEFDPRDRRSSLDDLLIPPSAPVAADAPTQAEQQRMRDRFLRARELRQAVASLADEEGAAALLLISSRDHGVVRGGGNSAGRAADAGNPLPEIVLTREQYNNIWRNVDAGVPVELEVDVRNRFFDDDLLDYNVFGEIPGSDLSDEYVMIGAHLDSWHYGQGATDNAAGSVVMMEAMRILKALGVTPRRTIRIALWSGEEQGLLGSRAWVAANPGLHDRISAYLNVDNGTGRIRGIWNQSNEAATPVFEQILWPFRDLGVVAVRHGDTGGTDHLAFDAAGIPGFNFIQDPIEYGVRTHHTELDTYDHLVLDDLKQAAVVVAATAYHLAMRDGMMPRK